MVVKLASATKVPSDYIVVGQRQDGDFVPSLAVGGWFGSVGCCYSFGWLCP